MPRRDIAIAVLVAAIWGVNFTVIRVGLDGVPPLLLSALRYTFAAVPLVFFLGRPAVPWRAIAAVGAAIGVTKFSLLFLGIDAGFPAGLASLVLQAQAGFTLAFGALALGLRPTRRQAAGLLTAAAGLALIGATRLGDVSGAGFAMVLAAAATWGAANHLIARVSGPDPMRFMLWTSVVPPLPLLALSLAFEGPREDWDALSGLSLGSLGAIAYLAWVATVVGWGLWGLLLRRHPASTVAPFSLLVPPFGLLSAALFLGEGVGTAELVATALILGGVLLGSRRSVPAGLDGHEEHRDDDQGDDRERPLLGGGERGRVAGLVA